MNNPFAIRKSPVEMIAAQAIALDYYVKLIPRGGKKPFVKACELDCGIAARVAIEELVHEIVETNADRKPDETFDVRIIDKETIFTAVLKSKGPLRNPIYPKSVVRPNPL